MTVLFAPPKEMGCPTLETPAAQSKTHTQDSTPSARATQLLRLPAYGRRLIQLRSEGRAPALAVLVVDGWEPVTILGEHAPWVLVIPRNEPIELLDFKVIAGLFVYVVTDTTERADRIAAQVWRFLPKMIYSWASEDQAFTFHARRFQ